MKYKAGDKVLIKSINWYNENKDSLGNIDAAFFDEQRSRFCGSIQTIAKEGYILGSGLTIYAIEDAYEFIGEESIEGLAEEEMSLDKAGQITDFEYEGLAYTLPEGYQFVDENGNVIQATKIVLGKKKKEYPKTYEECCAFVGFGLEWDNPFRINRDTHPYIKHLDKLMQGLCKLIICREAYWRIGGVEMGLGKPWKPSWDKCTGEKYCISRVLNTLRHDAVSNSEYHNRILAFPTEEMRDAFYENFKELIEQCKELL